MQAYPLTAAWNTRLRCHDTVCVFTCPIYVEMCSSLEFQANQLSHSDLYMSLWDQDLWINEVLYSWCMDKSCSFEIQNFILAGPIYSHRRHWMLSARPAASCLREASCRASRSASSAIEKNHIWLLQEVYSILLASLHKVNLPAVS